MRDVYSGADCGKECSLKVEKNSCANRLSRKKNGNDEEKTVAKKSVILIRCCLAYIVGITSDFLVAGS